jgi:hypothetical protein
VDGDAEAELTIEEPEIPRCQLAFKGKLYAATSSSSKPPDISPDTWAIALVRAARRRGKFRLVIPSSFCRLSIQGLFKQAGLDDTDWIELLDMFPGEFDNGRDRYWGGRTPMDSLLAIVEALRAGQDVLILSATNKISGFVPAVLSRISDPMVNVVKVWYPITRGRDYELTAFQSGYLYGLSDVRPLQELRKRHRYERTLR